MRRYGSDPEDAAPAAVLRALHRRGVGTLLRVTTSPSHVALTVAVSGGRCTLVFATTSDAPPRDAVEDVATALSESAEAGAVACAVPRAERSGTGRSWRSPSPSRQSRQTRRSSSSKPGADVWCTSTEGWRRAGGLQLTEGTVSCAAFDGRRVFWRETNGSSAARSAGGAAGSQRPAGARGARRRPHRRGRGPRQGGLARERGALQRRGASSGAWASPASLPTATACWSWRTRAAICVTYGAGIETTTLGRAAPGAAAAAPVAGGVALLAEGFVVFYPRRPFTNPPKRPRRKRSCSGRTAAASPCAI